MFRFNKREENPSAFNHDKNDVNWMVQTVDSNLLDIFSTSPDSKMEKSQFKMIQFSKIRQSIVFVAFLIIFAGAVQAKSSGEVPSAIDHDVDDLNWMVQTVDSNLMDDFSSSSDSKKENVKFIDNIEDFKAANPGIELIEMARADDPSDPSPTVLRRYYLGSRHPGDRLVWAPGARNTFSTNMNFQQTLNYRGPRLTYVEVLVNQSSNSGRAWFHSGGIGQGSAQVIVQALNTRYFHYQAKFYGR
jgi:hypothetical protein